MNKKRKKKTSLQNLAPNIYLQFTIFHWIILGTIAYPMFRTTHVRLWVPGTQRYSNTRDEFAGKHLTKRDTQIQLMPILEVWSIHSQSDQYVCWEKHLRVKGSRPEHYQGVHIKISLC